eukprot:TRINITY_DN9663_c0_g3_i1.p1 TRINITY_DN9663_c0_g3~~TRINITY_DN9663_c0_g3_i1.p1  ORF type:complete len:159 (+),score=6.76 TRINITY_DN9663_c0_g3_i1:51-479(+)
MADVWVAVSSPGGLSSMASPRTTLSDTASDASSSPRMLRRSYAFFRAENIRSAHSRSFAGERVSSVMRGLRTRPVPSNELGDTQCSICHDFDLELTESMQLRVLRSECGHAFHDHCVQRWVLTCCREGRAPSCPCCRAALQE